MTRGFTKEERLLRVINREKVDYLPSHINIADRARYGEISRALGLDSADELDDFLENHMHFTITLHDKPMFFRDVRDEIDKLHMDGYANPDWDNNIVYDDWGIGIRVGVGSFFTTFHPLEGKADDSVVDFMPDWLDRKALFASTIEERIRAYQPPDPHKAGNFRDWENDLEEYSGDFLVWPSGYVGIYEKTFHLTGFENFMLLMADHSKAIEELLDKVTDYKVEIAKKAVQLGFKIAHTGDDLGTQRGSIFSEEMFKTMLLPRLKRHWEVFTNAGIPIIFHSCGDITSYIPHLIDIGMTILEPLQPVMDFNFLKREYGKDLIFFGGIDTQVLPFIGAEETRKLTRDTIHTLGRGGGYIIMPSQEIMNDVPLENIKVMVETIREEREKVLELS
jgi:uroporphyrinogen decarboxylase